MSRRIHNPAFRLRSAVLAAGFVAAGCVLVGRAVYLQVLDTGFLKGQGRARYVHVVSIPAHRGMIVDRNGDPLAISTPVDSVWVNPQQIGGHPAAIRRLASLVEANAAGLRKRVQANSDREFMYVQRELPPYKAHRIAGKGLPGVYLQREYRRYYPTGEVGAHVIGFTNIDDVGQDGLELAFNQWLTGHPGRKRVIKDRLGQTIDDLGQLREPRPGKKLVLSLDRRIQYLAYRALKEAVVKHHASSGSVVVLNPDTGEILAMADQPGFNPNNRTDLKPSLYRNRAVTDVFEPGSTFKPFVIAAALQNGTVHRGEKFHTSPGWYVLQGHTIQDDADYGTLDLTGILAHSSNVGASKIALKLKPKYMWDMLRDFGFGRVTASGFPGERTGHLEYYARWQPIRQATIAFGYGVSVTALQLAHAYAVLADNGVRRPVTFLKVDHPPPGHRVITAKTARELRKMLTAVVKDGTGTRAAIPGYTVAGKTGTAHKFTGSGYSKNKYTAVFAGMLPAKHPRLVAVVVINDPKGKQYFGGLVAAPVFRQVMAGAARLLDIAPDDLPDRGRQVAGPGHPPRSQGVG
ncbi:MAG TPA: penicillin-binding protein 2 [Gammaproteobacteria bacterium]|nr:penicillin-binding protein 2 [Gammaproteobacteria bacterium]